MMYIILLNGFMLSIYQFYSRSISILKVNKLTTYVIPTFIWGTKHPNCCDDDKELVISVRTIKDSRKKYWLLHVVKVLFTNLLRSLFVGSWVIIMTWCVSIQASTYDAVLTYGTKCQFLSDLVEGLGFWGLEWRCLTLFGLHFFGKYRLDVSALLVAKKEVSDFGFRRWKPTAISLSPRLHRDSIYDVVFWKASIDRRINLHSAY